MALTDLEKARVLELLEKGANISATETDELKTLLANEPPIKNPVEELS